MLPVEANIFERRTTLKYNLGIMVNKLTERSRPIQRKTALTKMVSWMRYTRAGICIKVGNNCRYGDKLDS